MNVNTQFLKCIDNDKRTGNVPLVSPSETWRVECVKRLET